MKKKPLAPLPLAARALLPPPEQTVKCSVFTATLGVNPSGTAISATTVIVVDTPLPWPKPVFEHRALQGVDSSSTDVEARTVRVLASVPSDQRPPTATVFQRRGDDTIAVAITIGQRPIIAVVGLVLDAEDVRTIDGAREIDPRAVLICTQGTHDVCCGTEGTALVADLQADPRFGAVPIFRVSHTGGHRFAPTALTFPDGRSWAYVDADRLAHVLFHTASPSALVPWCRGSWAAPDPRSQAAENAVFGRQGWDDAQRTTRFEDLGNDIIRVTRGLESHAVRVTVTRDIPIIRCRAAGGLPAKPSTEFRAEIL